MNLSRYHDLMASVRHDSNFHSITSLVQPDDPEVMRIVDVLKEHDDFVYACHEFVNSFTTYKNEIGDYWATPGELLERRAGDCDDKAILLVSMLRNRIPAEKVFCAFGFWANNGSSGGHMWAIMDSGGPEDRILEATAGPKSKLKGKYRLEAIFNDKYAFSYPQGIRDFNLLPVTVEDFVSQ